MTSFLARKIDDDDDDDDDDDADADTHNRTIAPFRTKNKPKKTEKEKKKRERESEERVIHVRESPAGVSRRSFLHTAMTVKSIFFSRQK